MISFLNSNNNSITILIVIFCIILFIIAVAVFACIHKAKKNKLITFVEMHSIRLKELKRIKNEIKFYKVNNKRIVRIYDDSNVFDDLSPKDVAIYFLNKHSKEVIGNFINSNLNRKIINEANEKINNLKKYMFDAPIDSFNYETLCHIEDELFKKDFVPLKIDDFLFTVELSCMNKYRYDIRPKKIHSFTQIEVESLIKRLRNKRGYYYCDQEIYDSLCRVERSKVTNELRDQIKKRDGYRCKKCGTNYNLTIDHIIPISKGEKSVPENLQTLCEDCNKEKGNSI